MYSFRLLCVLSALAIATAFAQTPTTITLNVPQSAQTLGQQVTLTATVTPYPSAGAADRVTFYDGAGILGAASITKSGNQGTTSITVSLPSGKRVLFAYYSGRSGILSASRSASVAVQVNAVPSATYLASGVGTAGPVYSAIAAADVKRDGYTDLAVGTSQGFNVLVADGSGGFPSIFPTAGCTPEGLAVSDLDFDGNAEIVVVCSGNVNIYKRSSFTQYSVAKSFFTGSTGPATVLIADFNGDGVPDLLVTGQTGKLYLGAGSNFDFTLSNVSIGGPGSKTVAADFNRDGYTDVAWITGTMAFTHISNGKNLYLPPTPLPIAGDALTDLIAGDFDGDQKPDLAAVSSTGRVSIWFGDGAGGFKPRKDITAAAAGNGPFSIAAGEFDGDGRQDLAVCQKTSVQFEILRGDGAGGFQSGFVYPAPGGCNGMAVGDFNGDGRSDLAMTRATTGSPLGNSPLAIELGIGADHIIALSTDPQSAQVTKPFGNRLGVQVLTAANQPIRGVYVTFSGPGSGAGAVLERPAATDTSGRVTVGATANQIANPPVTDYKVTASLAGVAPVQFSLTNRPGPAADIKIIAGDAQQQTVGKSFLTRLQAAAIDAFGNNTWEQIVFGSPQNPGAVLSNSQIDAIGISSTDAKADTTAGPYKVDAMQGLTPGIRKQFALTNLADAPSSIAPKSGTPQKTATGTNFPQQLQAIVMDQYGNGIAGRTVTFSAGGAGTFQSSAVVITGVDGVATAPALLAGSTLGNFIATATTNGVTGSAKFNLSVLGTTTLTLGVSPAPTANFGQPVTLTATLAPSTATGTVSFYDVTHTVAGDLIGSGQITGGIATFKTILLDPGSHQFRAVFPATGQYGGSTSNTVVLSVKAVPGFSFLPPSSACTASGNRLATGDLNADGKADLVILARSAIQVCLGNGNGSFQSRVLYYLPGSTDGADVLISDLNGDGKADVVVSQDNPNGLAAFLGNGDGTFQAAIFTPGLSGLIASADFDKDGRPDVVVARQPANGVQFMRGLGNGQFEPKGVLPTGTRPVAVVARDFNGDGNFDIVTTNYGANSISVLLGQGDGKFDAAKNTAVGQQPIDLAAGDFNGDGYLDLAVVNSGSSISILLGRGDGTFLPALNSGSGLYPLMVVTGDFNGDGKVDLAVATADIPNFSEASISVLLGNGDGTFQTGLAYKALGQAQQIVVGDYNTDGRADFAIVDPSNTTPVLLAAVPASVVVTPGSSPQQKVVNGSFATLNVRVTDANGIALGNVLVTFQPPASGASATISPVTMGTGNSLKGTTLGAASTAATANSIAGSYKVTAAVAGIAPAEFALTNLPGPPASIVTASGTPQSQPINTAFTLPLKATVSDAFGNPVSGVAVTYTGPATGAGAALTSPLTTDASGNTSVTATANSTAGSYAVTAKVTGVATPASFALTNLMTLTFVSAPSGLGFRVNTLDYVSTSGPLTFAAGLSVPVDIPNPIQIITAQPNTKYRFHGWSTPLNLGPAAQSLIVPTSPTGNIVANFLTQYKLTVVGTATTAMVTNPSSIPADADGYYTVSFAGSPATVSVAGICIAGAAPTGLLVQTTGSALSATISNGASVTMDAPKTVTVQCPAAPSSISVVSGTPQSAVIGTGFAQPLQAVVRDASNNPVPNVDISFAAPASGAGAAVSSPVKTNSSGIASVTATANSTTGGYAVIASVAGVTPSAAFNLTNLPNTAGISVGSNYGDARFSVTVNGTKTDYTGVTGLLTVNSNDTVVLSHPPGVQTPSDGVRYDFYGWSGYVTDPVTLPTPIGSGANGIFFLASYKLSINGTAVVSPSSADGFYKQTPSTFIPVTVTGSCPGGQPVIALQITAGTYYPANGQPTPAGAPITVSNGSVVTMDRPWTADVQCPQKPPELFWGLPVTPQTANGSPNMVWFDSDGIPGPAPVAAAPAIPIGGGVWTSEGSGEWMDAVLAPGQPATLLVQTTGYGPELRAFRADGTSLTPCGSFTFPVLGSGEYAGVRVARSGSYALAVQGASPTAAGVNVVWKFPLNFAASGNCLAGGPTQIAVPSNPAIRNVDISPVTSRQAVLSGYSSVVTFIDPVSQTKLCDVPLNNGGGLSRIEAFYRPDGTEVWAASYDRNQIAVITPPGTAGGCTVSRFITAGFGSIDGLQGSSFHPDPNVPFYYVTSYPGGKLFVIDTNSKQVTAGTIQITGTYPLMTAVTRGPAYRLEVSLSGGGTLSYDVTTAAQAANPASNALGTHQSVSGWSVVHALRDVGGTDADQGALYAWGRNTFGGLGDGTNNSSSTPVKVKNLTGVVATAGGQLHSIALTSDGKVWTWGDNQYGELGNGTNTNSNVPVEVSGLTDIVAISAGSWHNLALTRTGAVWAWGLNTEGELGSGTNTNSSIPVQVSGLTGVVAIASGGYHNLALKSDGTLWTWGFNQSGQLGNGTIIDKNTPQQLTGITGVVAVAGGDSTSMALKADGTVWTWGLDVFELFVNGNTILTKVPTPVNGLTGIVAISAGQSFYLALKGDGAVWAWGYNQNGQLGNGTNDNITKAPAPVTGLSDVIALATGSNHSTALRKDGSLWGWGLNSFGELGNSGIVSYQPVPLISPGNVVSIGSGYNHTLAIVRPGN